MEPADSQEDEEVAAKVKTALELLEPLPAMLTALMEDDGPVRVGSYHDKKRFAAFIQMEVIDALESLKLMPLPSPYDQVAVRHTKDWLGDLTYGTHIIRTFLKYADYRYYTLTRRVAEFLRLKMRVKNTMPEFLIHWLIGTDPNRLRHLLSATSILGLPPPEAKEGGPPPVGIDCPTKKLLTWLMPWDEDRRQRVICIVGPAGMGKTTLALELRKLACQTSGQCCFHCCIMVQASRTTNRNEILLQDILSKVSDLDDQSRYTTLELLVPRIFECLQEKRYFIIIEDIWDASDWEVIKSAFPESHNDSRILITSCVKSVAWSCCNAALVHEMKALKDMDSQSLLFTSAFGSADHCPEDNIKALCDEILLRCEGIPLFLIGMADWLREDQEKEFVPQLLNQFDQALYPAYDDLPYELKLLCLNMSMLPPGYVFDKDCLMKKWVYEELVYKGIFPTAPSEDTERCFSSLIDRHIITHSCTAADCRFSPDDVDMSQWKVNPLMMQFFISKSAEKGFVYTSDTLNSAAASTPDYGSSKVKPRRVALHQPKPLLPSMLEKVDFSQTCSLSVSGAVEIPPFKVFVNLSSLDVEGWDKFNDDYLLEICKSEMIFLKCLTIKKTRVSRLPPDIKNLVNLVMFDLSFTQISELPLEVIDLEMLIDLDVRGTCISHFPMEKDRLSWHRLQVLRAGQATRMPLNASYFRRLRIVKTIDLREYPASVFEALANIQKLKLISMRLSAQQCTRGAFSDALLSCIQGWSELKSLTIHCEMGCSMEFLGSLSDPPELLEVFKVTSARFPTLPRWINSLERLRFVQITVCRLGFGDLDILGGLPRLECLVLSLDLIPGSAIVVENVGFPELVRFSLESPVPWITFETGAMRKLTYVQLKLCTCPVIQTSTLPSIGNLQSLTEVELFYCRWEMLSPNISMIVGTMREAILKHPNQITLSINGVEDLDESAVVVVPTVDEKAGREIVEFESEIIEEGIQHCS